MSRRRKRKYKSQEQKLSSVRAGRSFDEIISVAEDYLLKEDAAGVFATLEQLTPQQQARPYALYLRGMAEAISGQTLQAVFDLQKASLRLSDFPPVFMNLAFACVHMGWIRMGWYYAEQYLRRKPKDPEAERMAEEMIALAQDVLLGEAEKLGVTLERMKKAAFAHERAQLALQQKRYRQVLSETQKAIRQISHWVQPRNNRTLAYLFLGQVENARREAQGVLEIAPDNIHALGNLVKIFTSTLQWEQARPYAERLIEVVENTPLDDMDLGKAVESLAEWDDDDALWRLGERILKTVKAEELSASSWYIIGAAAINTGHRKEARKAFEYSERQEGFIVPEWLERGLQAARRRKGPPLLGPGLDGRFPYLHFSHFLHFHLLEHMLEAMEKQDAKTVVADMVRRYPFVAGGYRLMLWGSGEDEEVYPMVSMALDALAACGTPGAYAEIRKFAESRFGEDEDRIHAARLLVKAGQHDPAVPFKMWISSREEWGEVMLIEQTIREPEEPPCGPQVMELMEQSFIAAQEGDLDGAIRLLEEAVELEPDCAQAVHNLGAQYINLGEHEKGEALIRRSIEIDPDYLFAYATLAELALLRGDVEASKEYLAHIIQASEVPPLALRQGLRVQVLIGLHEKDLDSSQRALDMLKDLFPDFDQIEDLEQLLDVASLGDALSSLWRKNVHRYRERMLAKPISAEEGLADCLNRISSDHLEGTLRAWRLKRSGRKAQRIARLVEVMTDADILAYYVRSVLDEEARAALRWMLEADGVRPWEEFTARFGDDFDESPYWKWHEPETVPGVLRMSGLLAVGTLDDAPVAVVPRELRPLLRQILAAGE